VKPFIETIYSSWDSQPVPDEKPHPVGTLVIVPRESDIPLAKELFSKMFNKLGRSMAEEAGFLAIETNRLRMVKLQKDYQFKRLIMCGIPPYYLSIHSDLPFHVPVHWRDVYLLRTETPARLEGGSMEFKTAFWQAFRAGYPAGL